MSSHPKTGQKITKIFFKKKRCEVLLIMSMDSFCNVVFKFRLLRQNTTVREKTGNGGETLYDSLL